MTPLKFLAYIGVRFGRKWAKPSKGESERKEKKVAVEREIKEICRRKKNRRTEEEGKKKNKERHVKEKKKKKKNKRR